MVTARVTSRAGHVKWTGRRGPFMRLTLAWVTVALVLKPATKRRYSYGASARALRVGGGCPGASAPLRLLIESPVVWALTRIGIMMVLTWLIAPECPCSRTREDQPRVVPGRIAAILWPAGYCSMFGCLVGRGSLSGWQGPSQRALPCAGTWMRKDPGRLDLTGFGTSRGLGI